MTASRRAPLAGTRGQRAALGGPGARRAREVAAMSPAERVRELGALLARGIARVRLRQKSLDEARESLALCVPAVDGDGAVPAKEDA